MQRTISWRGYCAVMFLIVMVFGLLAVGDV